MTNTRPRRTGPRGFALLLVVAIAAAAMVVAVSLSRTAATAAQVSGREEGALLAANAARAGLERATAYAIEVGGSTGGDFDLVLDPLEEADCSNMDPGGANTPFDFTQIDGTNSILRPLFSDGSHVEWPTGSDTWWRAVPFDGGAYLVRFEDDGDDDCSQVVADLHANWTSNHTTGNCLEGFYAPAAAPPNRPGFSSAVNPVRDMNRAVWVISVGIYPGTDPSTARYRITERRMVTDISSGSGDAFFIDELHGEDNSTVVLESDESSPKTNKMHVDDSSNWSYCRAESYDWDMSGGSTGPAGACGALAHDDVDLGSTVTIPTLPTWNSLQWMDVSSSCNFLIRNLNGTGGGDPEGLWWWNNAGSFAGGTKSCGVATDVLNIPVPVVYTGALTNPANADSCWVPIMVSPEGTGGMFDPCAFGSALDPGGPSPLPLYPGAGPYVHASAAGGANPARWYPGNAAAPAANNTCNGYYSAPLAAIPTLPDFASTCGGGISLPGRAVVGACAACDGSEWAIDYINPPGDAQFSFRPVVNGVHHVPNGTYIYLGDWTPDAKDPNMQMLSGAPREPPMITLIIRGNLYMKNNVELGFGSAYVGPMPTTTVPAYTGLAVLGGTGIDAINNARLDVWGALYVKADAKFDNNSALYTYGPVVVEDELRTETNSRFEWRYADAFITVAAPPASLVRMSFPLRF